MATAASACGPPPPLLLLSVVLDSAAAAAAATVSERSRLTRPEELDASVLDAAWLLISDSSSHLT
nr:unnamed protein product [Digitaria exilis]